MEYKNETNAICYRLKIEPEIPLNDSKLGIALSTLNKDPINGLRHPVTDDANGWYIWCGDDVSQDDEFFSPLHFEHVFEYIPEIIPYLALPPGYRFQIDRDGYEDVWFDTTLLEA